MFDCGSKRVLGKVYSSNLGVVGQGIDDRLDGRSRGCWLSSRRHKDGLDGLFRFLCSDGLSVVGSRGGKSGDGCMPGPTCVTGCRSRYLTYCHGNRE